MYCGEWILNSYKTKEDKIYKERDELEQIIFRRLSKFTNWMEKEVLSVYYSIFVVARY